MRLLLAAVCADGGASDPERSPGGQPERDHSCCSSVAIDIEIIQEVLCRYGALQRFEIAVTMAGSLFELVPVIFPVRPSDARLSVDLFRQYATTGATARDAIHAAVMLHNGVAKIISTDDHFDQFEGLSRLNPQHLFGRR